MARFDRELVDTYSQRQYARITEGEAKEDREKAHENGMAELAKLRKIPFASTVIGRYTTPRNSRLATTIVDIPLDHPTGIGAGLIKDGENAGTITQAFGASFIEVGTVTYEPQLGKQDVFPRVRMFPDHEAMTNRMGFPSTGIEATTSTLSINRLPKGKALFLNLGPNADKVTLGKGIDDKVTLGKGIDDMVEVLQAALALSAEHRLDIAAVVLNAASPNTPGLRDLLTREGVAELTRRSKALILGHNIWERTGVRLGLKFSPDMTKPQIDQVLEGSSPHTDFLVISNTTTDPEVLEKFARTASIPPEHLGGASGRPVRGKMMDLLDYTYVRTQGQIPLVAVGGIGTGENVYTALRYGASAVEMYTYLFLPQYFTPNRIWYNSERLLEMMDQTGGKNMTVSELIGSAHPRERIYKTFI
jgi:dihydroorotate dehydrogenase